jgi:hypothetical protein
MIKQLLFVTFIIILLSLTAKAGNILFFWVGSSGNPAVGGACAGVIDFSTGCVQPMALGGL